jgi:hypothetical protein
MQNETRWGNTVRASMRLISDTAHTNWIKFRISAVLCRTNFKLYFYRFTVTKAFAELKLMLHECSRCVPGYMICKRSVGLINTYRSYWNDFSSRSMCGPNAMCVLKSHPVTGLEWPRGFHEFKVPRLHDNGTGWW